ncbi:hypothetical protein AMAG_12892 [Allomyces macrogynus ATCC 38327]|uniref:Brl1/Brr6 domain-containing protein n=1 Tax=Allomyces macrogynus (strain ATCC 38327) TaxID=578462 RepID=A0A0L0T0V8_ALLM3|nr:hypothetical protein AMAG_12892 [Allomyces macrogynus ATCC 38327]|eukprot:KNE68214.1 hypothetical protein AMAG_12892 [Allomyces macrogynus ATCC 38327]
MMRGNEAPMQVDSPRPQSALAGPTGSGTTGSGTTSSSTAPRTPFSFGRSTVPGPSTPAAFSAFTFAPKFSTPLRTPMTPATVKASRRSHYSDPPSPGLPRTPSDDDRDEHESDEYENEMEPVATPAPPSFLGKARQSLSNATESAKKLSAAVFTAPACAPPAVPATPASTAAADVFRTPSMTPSRAGAARSRLSTTVTPRQTGPLRPHATPGTAPRPSKRARQASESGDDDSGDDGDACSTTSYAMSPHVALTPYHHAMHSPMYSTPYPPPQLFPMTFTPMRYAAGAQPTDDDSDLENDKLVEPAPAPALPPHLALLGYLQVLWNVLLASAGAYVVYTAYAAAAADLAHRFQAYTADEAAKIDECARQYVTNRCDPATRVPAVNAFCLDLEKCMHADPTRVPATALSAAAVAELIDAFVAKLSYKSLGFLLAIASVTAMMNWACSCARPRTSAASAPVSKPVARRARLQRTPMHHAHHVHHPAMYSPFGNPYAGAYGSPMAYMSPAGPQHVPPTPGTAGSVVKRRMGAVVEEEE